MENRKPTNDIEKELFSKLEVSYSKSKGDVWDAIEKQIASGKQEQVNRGKIIQMFWIYRSVAAILLLGLCLGLFARFYTTSIILEGGKFTSHTLPDGSIVHLNASSRLAYSPYWWAFDRKIELEGEAYFEVEKGQKFSVYSKLGHTEVLGTKFNIYSRGTDYEVFCVTGKVRVLDKKNSEVILTPGNAAKLQGDGKLQKDIQGNTDTMIAWRLNKFNYNATPLSKVFGDVARHYNIKIKLADKKVGDLLFTGLFDRSPEAEKSLEIICTSFELSFKKKEEQVYYIK